MTSAYTTRAPEEVLLLIPDRPVVAAVSHSLPGSTIVTDYGFMPALTLSGHIMRTAECLLL